MSLSAVYICPLRGLAGLQPPEPHRLRQAASAAGALGVNRLLVPVLEESLLGPVKDRTGYLDGLIKSLDRVTEAGSTAWLIAPAQRLLGLDWAAPFLVGASEVPGADPVFTAGRVRRLKPYPWWIDPALMQKRIKIFREIAAAVCGHPALSGWLLFDRVLNRPRPDLQAADLFLRSLTAEIRERDEAGSIYLSLDWRELLMPDMVRFLAPQVDGLRFSGLEKPPRDWREPEDLDADQLLAAYFSKMARWLFERPAEVEIGWDHMQGGADPECIRETQERLAGRTADGLGWLSLVDPEPGLFSQPPWHLHPGSEHAGLLDAGLEPKRTLEAWLDDRRTAEPSKKACDFIDLSPEAYLSAPQIHLPRLWDHFLESK
jgi:hypothetical protein